MKRFGVVLLGASLLVAQPLAGQMAPGDLNDTETIKYLNWDGTFNAFRTKVGPYSAALQVGADPTWANISIVCVDYGNHVFRNSIWDANVTNIGMAASDADMFNTRVGTAEGSLLKYKKAAYLSSMFWSSPKSETAWKDLHWAIWSIMSPQAFMLYMGGTYQYVPATNWVQILDENNDWMAGFDFTEWSVLSDQNMVDGRGGVQEQLVRNPSMAPEPQTYVLLLSGFIFLAFVGRRRLKEMGYF